MKEVYIGTMRRGKTVQRAMDIYELLLGVAQTKQAQNIAICTPHGMVRVRAEYESYEKVMPGAKCESVGGELGNAQEWNDYDTKP